MHNQLFDAYVFILHRATAGELRRYARVANFRTASDIHLFSLFLIRFRKAFFNCSSCFSKILFNNCARLYLSNNFVIFLILMHSSKRHDEKNLSLTLRTLNIFSNPILLDLFLLNWDRYNLILLDIWFLTRVSSRIIDKMDLITLYFFLLILSKPYW